MENRTKNPRYLETRVDVVNPLRKYIADMGVRLHRKIPLEYKVIHPVDAVLACRRNNPPEPGIRALAVITRFSISNYQSYLWTLSVL